MSGKELNELEMSRLNELANKAVGDQFGIPQPQQIQVIKPQQECPYSLHGTTHCIHHILSLSGPIWRICYTRIHYLSRAWIGFNVSRFQKNQNSVIAKLSLGEGSKCVTSLIYCNYCAHQAGLDSADVGPQQW